MKSLSFATLVAIAIATASAQGTAKKVADPLGQCAGEGFGELDCPKGYQCQNFDQYFSQCTPIDEVDPYASFNNAKHEHEKRQAATRVTGPTVGKNERWPVQRLANELPDVYNMFILGLYAMQRVDEQNMYSYYSIAGIHGAPYESWGEDPIPENPIGLGYCTHSSGLFATWHRPYLSILEQRIHYHAMQEADKFQDGNRAKYQDAARRVRLPYVLQPAPYWDWSSSDLQGALPPQLTQPTVRVTNWNPRTQQSQTVYVNNPLYTYRFTSTRKLRDFANMATLRDLPMTMRDPDEQYRDSRNDLASQSAQRGYATRRQNTYNLFAINNFNQFSNRAFTPGGAPSTYNNLESVHDNLHVDMGGFRGHMRWVQYSAFDPVFFLHHCNIDRLAAIYQATHPGLTLQPQAASMSWANPRPQGQTDTIDTPLRPFRKPNGQYYTSRDFSSASSVWAMNYAYPEVPYRFASQSASALQSFARGRVNALYGPTGSARKVKRDTDIATPELEKRVPHDAPKREYLLHASFSTKDLWGGGQVYIYFGKPSDDEKARRNDVGLVGTISSFSSAEMKMDMPLRATVPLTEAIESYGTGLDPNATIPFLDSDLEWVVMKDDKELPIDNIPSLRIGVSSAEITYVDGLKQYGEWETYYELTQDLPGGYNITDVKTLVDAMPAPPILSEIKEAVGGLLDDITGGLKDLFDKAKSKKERIARKRKEWREKLGLDPKKGKGSCKVKKHQDAEAPELPKLDLGAVHIGLKN